MTFHFKRLLPTLLLAIGIITGCGNPKVDHWIQGVPDTTPIIVLSSDPSDIQSSADNRFAMLASQATNTQNENILNILSRTGATGVRIEGIAVYPASADEWRPVWILSGREHMSRTATEYFSRQFTASDYKFGGLTIQMLHLPGELIVYGIDAGKVSYFSESSIAIEDFARTIKGQSGSLSVPIQELRPGRVVVNTPHLDRYIATETAVRYRPAVLGAFNGTGVAVLDVRHGSGSSTSPEIELSGDLALRRGSDNSALTQALTTSNHINILDRYISQDAALAVFMNGKTRTIPAITERYDLDLLLGSDASIRDRINSMLGENFAMAAFASSGFLSVGDFAYLRMVDDMRSLRGILSDWVNQDLITSEGENYIIQSKVLSHLITGGTGSLNVFHLTLTGDAILITQRPALIQKLVTDRDRRRTLYYTEQYLNIRRSYPEQLSGFVYGRSEDLTRFVQTLVNTSHAADLVLGNFNIISMGFTKSGSSDKLNWITRTYRVETTIQPYEDRWLVRLDGTELVAPPTLSNIGGSSRNEILAATRGGTIIAIAADGTQVFRVNTGADVPIGAPITYDWYANNQIAILQGAGNKIYGWSSNGTLLPGFPIVLNENLSSPILITDVNRNGLAEIVAATSDRQIHVLDQRGNNINGWPQSVNAVIRTKPVIETWNGRTSIIAYAENVLFAWETNGILKPGFPMFNRAPFRGPVLMHNDHLIVGSADGTIISAGRTLLFPQSQAPVITSGNLTAGEMTIQGIRIAEGGILIRPEISSHSIRLSDETNVTEPVLFAMSDAGSIFAVNMDGSLRFSQSLGQPSMQNQPPMVVDVNRDGNAEVIGIAGFGRMYAWQLNTGQRYYDLPTTSMVHPVFSDINGNGRFELIAGTSEGLRSWTINR